MIDEDWRQFHALEKEYPTEGWEEKADAFGEPGKIKVHENMKPQNKKVKPQKEKISMVHEDIEAHIFKASFNDVNF